MGMGLAVGVLGVLILSHAAYTTIQYRSLLKITEDEFSGAPINVVMELIAGLMLCMWAGLTVPGKFLSILPYSDENRDCRGLSIKTLDKSQKSSLVLANPSPIGPSRKQLFLPICSHHVLFMPDWMGCFLQ